MMKTRTHLIASACVAALIFGGPSLAFAASKKKEASPAPSASPEATAKVPGTTATKPPRAVPFRGVATAVDQSAKTFTIAGKEKSRVFKLTDKSTITKAGAPATLADLNDNEAVTGSYMKETDGTLEVKSLKIGGKTDTEKTTSKKKSKKSEEAAASPSPSPKK